MNHDTSIVIGLIGAIGCNRQLVVSKIEDIATKFSYQTKIIKISDLFNDFISKPLKFDHEYDRIINKMDNGDKFRKYSFDNTILAKYASIKILNHIKSNIEDKYIYVIDSLKRPEEVNELRNIFGDIFSLLAIHSSDKQRNYYLKISCDIKDDDQRNSLIERDKNDKLNEYGQCISDAFHLADFFIDEERDEDKIQFVIFRYFDLIFGNPYITPTFPEYSMYMAHAAAIQSADLSRQTGAVITIKENIISTGSNECPKSFGGTYWPNFDSQTYEISDAKDGRDYKRNQEYNAIKKNEIITKLKCDINENSIVTLNENIKSSGINDITEFYRSIHAEMDAILSCARRGISTDKTILYCTTYPCHNCAKHIITSGISKVVFIEPYPKSDALKMYYDSMTHDENESDEKILFKPFIGVGPRQYINLFSMHLSPGRERKRKTKGNGKTEDIDRSDSYPRMKTSYKCYSHIIDDFEKNVIEKLTTSGKKL